MARLSMWLYYFFATLVVIQGLASWRGGVRYLRYVRREIDATPPAHTPFASIIAPCRGLDQELRENLRPLFGQDYPAYEIIFVVDRADDPAAVVIAQLRGEFAGLSHVRTKFVVAGPALESGQKVHNLLAALEEVGQESEALVFVDSDARPRADWLRHLTAPLADPRLGAATGYRWFIPARRSFGSLLRAVWNASIATALGPRTDRNFCWGGSTAVRREVFDRLGMREHWRGTLSDDYGLTRALHEARLPIRFVPQCLVASHEDVTFREALEFTTRQIKITRVYAQHLWRIVLWTNLIFVGVFFGGLLLGFRHVAPLIITGVIALLGVAKAALRLRAVALLLPAYQSELRAAAPAYLFLWPLTAALYLYNAVAALFSRRLTWRGLTYKLKSPRETVIIRTNPQAEDQTPFDASCAGRPLP